jgi:hypothetical protein
MNMTTGKSLDQESQQPVSPLNCEACGNNAIKSRMIWLNPENGQIYPIIRRIELLIFLMLMVLSLSWFVVSVIYHQNPFLMVVSVALFSTLITINVVIVHRFLSRNQY